MEVEGKKAVQRRRALSGWCMGRKVAGSGEGSMESVRGNGVLWKVGWTTYTRDEVGGLAEGLNGGGECDGAGCSAGLWVR